ncbi:MAG: thioredoxin family protein [Bacteroidota bacterium]
MKITILNALDFTKYLSEGLSFAQYRSDFEKNALAAKSGNAVGSPHPEVLPLNWQRSTRVEKTFLLDPVLMKRLEALDHKLVWLVITESWCGDSAQSLPVIARIAEASHGMIDLRIILRDTNIELMDAFLTDGKRGIPKLIQLDSKGNILKTWGPRPLAAQELIDRLKRDPVLCETHKEELHKWYAHDRCESIQKELSDLLPLS